MNKTVSIYLDQGFYQKISKIADEDERSLNWLINKILKEWVDNYEAE